MLAERVERFHTGDPVAGGFAMPCCSVARLAGFVTNKV